MQLETPAWTDEQRAMLREEGGRSLSAAGLLVTITAEGELHVEIPPELQRQIVDSAIDWVR